MSGTYTYELTLGNGVVVCCEPDVEYELHVEGSEASVTVQALMLDGHDMLTADDEKTRTVGSWIKTAVESDADWAADRAVEDGWRWRTPKTLPDYLGEWVPA